MVRYHNEHGRMNVFFVAAIAMIAATAASDVCFVVGFGTGAGLLLQDQHIQPRSGRRLALKNIGSAPDTAVLSMCDDDRFMNVVFGIYEKFPAGTPIRIKAASANAATTAEQAGKDDSSDDDTVKSGIVMTTEGAFAPWATARIVSPTASVVSPKRKAGEDPRKNGAGQPPLPAIYLDGGWSERCTTDSDAPPPPACASRRRRPA